MAYKITENRIGLPAIGEAYADAQNLPLGTIVQASDPDRGSGEFIWLKGLDSTVLGSWVTYNTDDYSTALSAANAIGPVAVASAAIVTGEYGWYQIDGKPQAKAADVADNGRVYLSGSAGVCDDALVAGDRVWNAKWASEDDTDTNLADVEIARPFVTDKNELGDT